MSESSSNSDSENELKISDTVDEPNVQSRDPENPDDMSDDENDSLVDSIQSPIVEQKSTAVDREEDTADKSPHKLSDNDDSDAEAENDNVSRRRQELSQGSIK